jgi:L-cysteine:1D-myo-inositol 2-amino-2-deoxy-alpha-D-glucopyranoside ligase
VKTWSIPPVPALPPTGILPRVLDTRTGDLVVAGREENGAVGLYVCGITPYDATHLGHAATYVAFDLLVRAWRDAGREVRYVQNITDIDDPLLERAEQTGQDWTELATSQIDLFVDDMRALRVLPPTDWVAVTDYVEPIAAAVREMVGSGRGYSVPTEDQSEGAGDDVYLDLSVDGRLGALSGWSREQMMEVFADRGGDPDRPGKRDPFDPLLWRAARDGEPTWDGGSLGPGRPGWHVECAVIARDHLHLPFDVQGGGSDLVFPHHDMTLSHVVALGADDLSDAYAHAGMVGLHGEKMSKSKGNLVFVSRLLADGAEPAAIRLALLAHHYRSDWEWTAAELERAEARLARWRRAAAVTPTLPAADAEAVRSAVRTDLDAPAALAAVDAWAERVLAAGNGATGGEDAEAACRVPVTDLVDALLGVAL